MINPRYLPYVKKVFNYGYQTVTLEIGSIAKQATAAVLVDVEGTTLLIALVLKLSPVSDTQQQGDCFPLTVHYQEGLYAAGKIPGGYGKRQGRPGDHEILIAREIDRVLRVMLLGWRVPKNLQPEVQVNIEVISYNPEVSTDIPAMIGASAALTLSGIPLDNIFGAARVGYDKAENNFLLNPNDKALENSELNLVVAGTEKAILMVEAGANELPESTVLDAIIFGHQHLQEVIKNIKELKSEAGLVDLAQDSFIENSELRTKIDNLASEKLSEIYKLGDKNERYRLIDELENAILEHSDLKDHFLHQDIIEYFNTLKKELFREKIIEGGARLDGRDTRTVRPISIRVPFVSRTHGSAVFTRNGLRAPIGTQACAFITLGTGQDALILENLKGKQRENFMLHYNFPGYSTGEISSNNAPNRRAIGHGKLAQRAIEPILPSLEEFPYVIQAIVKITESDGSSSMATICSTILALMDAGVPVKNIVAGIAMGLIKKERRFAVLSDISGDEDALGDMDFKVAGTKNGITALQMDIKTSGITRQILQSALNQAREGLTFILGEIEKALPKSRETISEFAPRITTINISPDKIRDVIGKGGVTIRSICEKSGATVDINDQGVVTIFAVDAAAGQEAERLIKALTTDVEIGQVYQGTVEKLLDFGALITLLPGKSGLLHISQIADSHTDRVTDVFKEGQTVTVKVIEIDRQGRIRLSSRPSMLK